MAKTNYRAKYAKHGEYPDELFGIWIEVRERPERSHSIYILLGQSADAAQIDEGNALAKHIARLLNENPLPETR